MNRELVDRFSKHFMLSPGAGLMLVQLLTVKKGALSDVGREALTEALTKACVCREADEAALAGAQTTIERLRKDLNDERAARTEDCRNLLQSIEGKDAEIARLRKRYQWAANELLACDYGDNDAGRIGWRVYGWRDRAGKRRIFGDSIDQAIDAEIP